MQKSYFLGIDLGTTYLKVGLYNIKGDLINSTSRILKLYNPEMGIFYQDPDEFFSKTLESVRECIGAVSVNPKLIKGISADGQMGGIMAVDGNFNKVIDYDILIDEKAKKYSYLFNIESNELIYKNTGCVSLYGQKILYWNRNKKIFNKICRFIQPSDYILGKLCGLKGEEAFMNSSYLCFSGLGDAEKLDWSKSLCTKFNIDLEKLPRIVDAFEVIGFLNKKSAEKCGLVPGIPVAAGGGDGSVTRMGAGFNKKGMSGILSGTANEFFHVTEKIYYDNKFKLPHPYSIFKNLKYIANHDWSGQTHFWFVENFLGSKDHKAACLKIEKKLSGIPGTSDKLIFLPNFQGTLNPYKPYIRGGWIGLNISHKKEHLYKSVLESVAYNRYMDWQKIMEACDHKEDEIDKIFIIGGGAGSDAWCKIIADVFNKQIVRYVRKDFATLGSAFIAAKATDHMDDIIGSLEGTLKIGSTFNPDISNHKKYADFIEIYREALEALENVFIRLGRF